MKPTNFKVFEGRNIYSHRKCIKLYLNMESIAKLAASDIDLFTDRLINLLPSLANHRCCLPENHRLMKNFKEKPYLHHICGHIAIALQNMIGLDVSFCSESKIGYSDFYTIYEYKFKNTGIEAGKLAVLIINSLLKNSNLDLSYSLKILESTLNSDIYDCETGSIHTSNTKKEIPIIAITGTNGKTTTTRLIAYALSKAGLQVGVTTTDGIYINNECIFEGDNTGPRSALEVLSHSEIDAAVLETARGGIVRNGIAYDLADVAVITNIADDHLGLDGIETMEDLANAKMLVGEAVKDRGYVVINGDNALSVSNLHRIKSKLIIFSEDKNNQALRANIQNGGYGIYTHEGVLYFENSDSITELMPIKDIAITFKGALRHNIQNAMAACGALMGFGVSELVIKEALISFKCDEHLNPGRFNSFDVNGTHVILDYGHNVDGYSSVLEGLSNMPHKSLIGVIGVPGDRQDRNTIEIGRISGAYFNRIFIKEDKDRRGRLPGEIAELLKKGVLSSGFDSRNIEIILDEETALKEAIECSEPGDVVIIFFEDYAPLLRLVKEKVVEETAAPLVV